MNKQPEKQNELKQGLLVFLILALMTALEFYLGISHAPTLSLVLVALLKAIGVIWYFMHIRRVFSSNEGDHE